MQIMMPLMFGYFTTQFASGLALYFVISNVVGIVMQWAIERIEGPVVPIKSRPAADFEQKEKAQNGKKPVK
jgi:membrane protein insertase Oxa1/YidC/SpoIIIJ